MAYKLDRRTLIDPDLVMSSHTDLSFAVLGPNSRGSQPSNSLIQDMFPGSEAGHTETTESPRIPLPNSVTAMLHQYLSGRGPEPVSGASGSQRSFMR
jgi:hypothetical protein